MKRNLGTRWVKIELCLICIILLSTTSCRKKAESSTKIQPLPSNPQQGTVWDNTIGMKLGWIPQGEFMMGTPEHDEKPIHQVKISKGFYMGVHEVTQEQYQKVMGTNPSKYKGYDITMIGSNPQEVKMYTNLPVEAVNWNEAVEFCNKLSQQESRTYRLPTEAEWEYACRAGTTTRYSFGDNDSQLGDYAWWGTNSAKHIHPVGGKKPNPWGIYDMYGNVWEWCHDWYGKDYYASSPAIDPLGPVSGQFRVFRGGAWGIQTHLLCRSAARYSHDPNNRFDTVGFRVILVLE